MVKSLTFLAFAAVATAAPQFGLLSSLEGLKGLKPGSKSASKSASAAAATASGETLPDTLSYNRPLEEDDEDWHKYVTQDPPKDPSDTEGTPIGFEQPKLNISTSTSTRSTTLRQIKSTTAQIYATTARDEIPAYSTPVTTQNNEIESYQTPSAKPDVQSPEPYKSTTVQEAVQSPSQYHTSTTVQAAVQEPYAQTQQAEKLTSSYKEPVQNDVAPSAYSSTSIKPDVQEPYAQTTQKAVLTSSYNAPVQNDVAPTPSPYRRDLEGYGQAEYSKTSRAAACAVKPSAASAVVSPAVAVSSPPAFRQAVESAQPSQESSPVFAAKESSSPVWSATPYSSPAVKPAVVEPEKSHTTVPVQEQQTSTTSIPEVAATTPLADAAVPSDAQILVNTLRPASIVPESTVDVKMNTAYSETTSVAQAKAATTTAPVATADASKLLQPLYPTTTGASNVTMGRPAASTGAHSNNTLPEFEGAAASSSSFIAGSVIALAIAAFAL